MNTVTVFELLVFAIAVGTVLTGFVSKRLADRRRAHEQRRVTEFVQRQSRLAAYATATNLGRWQPARRRVLATLPVGPGADGHAAARRLLDERDGRAA